MHDWHNTHSLLDEVVEVDYSWAAIGIFARNTDGALFWATDSGCSCYGPWENEVDFTPLTDGHWHEFVEALNCLDDKLLDPTDKVTLLASAGARMREARR